MTKENKLNYYYKKNNIIGYLYILSYLIFFIGLIFIISISDNILLLVILSIVLGFFQAGFNQGKHEFLHNSVVSHTSFNSFFWYLFSLPILVNPHLNKSFHLLHHSTLGTKDDPELSFKVRETCSFNDVLIDKIKNPFILGLILQNFNIIFKNTFPNYVKSKDKKKIKIDSIILMISHIFFIILMIYFQNYFLLFLWYITLEYIGFNILCAFDIAEHRGCDLSDFENDSRTIISNWFITYITWFNNYHSVHHKDKKNKIITFYKRKKYFDEIDKYKTHKIEKGYISFLSKINKNPQYYN